MNTPIIGLVTGVAAGAAVGVAWERTSHTPKRSGKPEGFDDWKAGFKDHFSEEFATDATRNEQFDAEVRAWTKSHPLPEGMTAGRVESDIQFGTRRPKQRNHFAGLAFLLVGGVGASTAAVLAFEKGGVDRLSFHGARGFVSTLPIAFAGAAIGAFMISNATH